MTARIQILSGESMTDTSVCADLEAEGLEVIAVEPREAALEQIVSQPPEVLLVDLELEALDAVELVGEVKRTLPSTSVVVLSDFASPDPAIAALEAGADDFACKPAAADEVVAIVERALSDAPDSRAETLGAAAGDAGQLVYRSAEMARIVDEIALIASKPIPLVLIRGESGTGKQLIARMLHERSERAGGPFVELNCAAMPSNLVETELFGHERSAYTDARERKLGLVEVASGGTLFLDEIGDLALPAQAKLLTFLEDHTFRRVGGTRPHTVDVRVVAATNRDLAAMAREHTFRHDLLYRMLTIVMPLPPLRQRVADIGALAEHFLATSSRTYQRRWRGISPQAMRILERYPWPGNARELRGIVSRAALLFDGELLRPEHLPRELVETALRAPLELSGDEPDARGVGIPTLAEIEDRHIRRVFQACNGSLTLSARRLGITRQTLAKKLRMR